MHPPFRRQTFDTVICDPPFSYYNKFKWITRLADLARKRFLLSTSANNIYLKESIWDCAIYAMRDRMFLRLYYCFDRRVKELTSWDPSALGKVSDSRVRQ